MGWEGVGYATRIEGKMDAQLYTNILGDELLKSLEWFKLNVEDVYFQQDNYPKHTYQNGQEVVSPIKITSQCLNKIS